MDSNFYYRRGRVETFILSRRFSQLMFWFSICFFGWDVASATLAALKGRWWFVAWNLALATLMMGLAKFWAKTDRERSSRQGRACDRME